MNEHRSILEQPSLPILRWAVVVAVAAFTLLPSLRAQTHLADYIAQGLASNEGIRQREFALRQSLYALDEAKRLFMPNVRFEAAYFLAGGGRTVDFPVGDILNPVYATLNQLTQTNNFPTLENQSVLLNPNNFYDVKFRTTMPLLNPEIGHGRRISTLQTEVQGLEVAVYKRELVKDIKVAYFRHLQAREAARIYESAITIAQEQQRISRALLANGQANRTAVVRGDAELARYEALLAAAHEDARAGMAYFNFLLNRPLDADILADTLTQVPESVTPSPVPGLRREELTQLSVARAINEEVVGLTKSYTTPRVGLFADLGVQGFNWELGRQNPYYFVGISMQWDVFTAGRNRAKVAQTQVAGMALAAQTSQAESQIAMQRQVAVHAFQSALAQYRGALSLQVAAERYHTDMLRLYKEGAALFVEVLDAQNQWVGTRLQANIALFDCWAKAAEVERAEAGFRL